MAPTTRSNTNFRVLEGVLMIGQRWRFGASVVISIASMLPTDLV